MLTRFEIDNFKSLVGFSLPLSRFNCVIGLNGAGKTTLLQALDFTSHVMSGEVKDWLAARNWSAADLTSRFGNKSNIELAIEVEIDGWPIRWEATFNRTRLACTREMVRATKLQADGSWQSDGTFRLDGTFFELKGGKYWHRSESTDAAQWNEIPFIYQGSLLSQLKDNQLSPLLRELRERIKVIRSLDLLSPEQLRRKTRLADLADDIGSGGQQLGAFIHQLKAVEREQLLLSLQRYYPQVTKIHTSVLRGGAVKLELHESYQTTAIDGQDSLFTEDMVTEARHINDGMLRLLAILAQQFSPYEFVLFDEIENGVNPEITEALVDALVGSAKQLLVTTHSPLVLNYLEDDVARQSVLLIYKRPDGVSRAIRLFDVPMAAERLECLSPGESMLDLSLTRVAEAAEQMAASSHEGG
ncbi:AAA family ATPase [Aeromonas hydrophila]|uniref:AAA family ATPase n=1 Tax=Aeromonas hydrophila TaxID=644 RepID=UPI001C5AF21A|nr:ATP-binding protein [Aeromonas hydrophila]MBW3845326.1 AAA family ATPase [Aeromonas hydrophila]